MRVMQLTWHREGLGSKRAETGGQPLSPCSDRTVHGALARMVRTRAPPPFVPGIGSYWRLDGDAGCLDKDTSLSQVGSFPIPVPGLLPNPNPVPSPTVFSFLVPIGPL